MHFQAHHLPMRIQLSTANCRRRCEAGLDPRDRSSGALAATTAGDQAKVQAAEEKLAQPLALLVLPRNAGCKVTSAKVVIARESETDHNAHEHEENAHAEAGGHEAQHS